MPSSDAQYLYLTTTGRKSGLPRQIEIWFVTVNDRYYVLAEHGRGAQWVRNILSDPRVRVRSGSRDAAEFGATARVVDEHADPELWAAVRRLSAEKYGWGGGLPVEIMPDAPQTAGAVSQSS